MTEDEKEKIQEGLQARRNELQRNLAEARKQRAELQLKDIDEYRFFLQKVGQLSLLLGAAIIPLVIVNNSKVTFLDFVLLGTTLYLTIGILAFWRSKGIFEKNADYSPYIGLEEEIKIYPIVYAHNKLLSDIENKTYLEEFRSTSTALLAWNSTQAQENNPKVSIWLDLLLLGFAIASLLIVRPLWPYGDIAYWIAFLIVILGITIFISIGYMRSWKNQVILIEKQKELGKIKSEYQKWHNDNILNPKD